MQTVRFGGRSLSSTVVSAISKGLGRALDGLPRVATFPVDVGHVDRASVHQSHHGLRRISEAVERSSPDVAVCPVSRHNCELAGLIRGNSDVRRPPPPVALQCVVVCCTRPGEQKRRNQSKSRGNHMSDTLQSTRCTPEQSPGRALSGYCSRPHFDRDADADADADADVDAIWGPVREVYARPR